VAQQLIHPHYQVWGLHIGALFYQLCRDASAVQELAEALVAQATEQGIQIGLATGRFLRQWALAQEDVCQERIDLMHQAIVPYRTHGSRAGLVRCLELVSEIQGRYGEIEDGLAVLAEAETLVGNTGEHIDAAELYRLKGELLQKAAGGSQQAEGMPEAYLLQALGMAHRQQAKSLELRAAMSLSRLWQQQGKRREAYQLLAETYGWFTEGLDTVDLQEARMLLEELAG
jgi:predicted ATPase